MIELAHTEGSRSATLIVDSVEFPLDSEDDSFLLTIQFNKIDMFASYSPSDLSTQFCQLSLRLVLNTDDDYESVLHVTIKNADPTFGPDPESVERLAFLELNYKLGDWKYPFSVREHMHCLDLKLRGSAEGAPPESGSWLRALDTGRMMAVVHGHEWKFGDVCPALAQLVRDGFAAATDELTDANRPLSVVEVFDFPEAFRVPCGQYLLYFAEFLKDLGIEATTDLRHEAGKVLFSVTPSNEADALAKIREALDLYVRIPCAGNSIDSPEILADPRVQQLAQNVAFLQNQVMLMQATNLQLAKAMNAQGDLLAGSILQTSRQIESNQRSKVDVIPGVLAVGTFESNGVHIDLAELLRRAKRYFRNWMPGDK